mmetsp:Transcript_135654/g.351687  ORF Transcript_135654/g.351687 Transcript_135654/m.351687 type:complete len:273 (-) Transcript_135654:1186-2004(-)
MRLQVRSRPTVLLLELVRFEVWGQLGRDVRGKADLLLLLSRDHAVDSPADEGGHVEDLEPAHAAAVDLLEGGPERRRRGGEAARLQRRDGAEDVGEVDEDDPVLDPARDHYVPQGVLQREDHTTHNTLLVAGHWDQPLQPNDEARPAEAVPPVEVKKALLQVGQDLGLGHRQAPDPLLDHRLHQLNRLIHIPLARLQDPQRMELHVPREVAHLAADAALREGAVELCEGGRLGVGKGGVEKDLPRPLGLPFRVDAAEEELGRSWLEQRDLLR